MIPTRHNEHTIAFVLPRVPRHTSAKPPAKFEESSSWKIYKQLCENLQMLFCSRSVLLNVSLSIFDTRVQNLILLIIFFFCIIFLTAGLKEFKTRSHEYIHEPFGALAEYKKNHIIAHIVISSRVLSIVCQV